MGLHDRIKNLRKQKNMTQSELGKKVNVSPQVISNWERKYTDPDHDDILKLSDALDCSADYLLGLTDDPTPPKQRENNNSLPDLTPKDERDIGRDLDRIMNNLESDDALAFYGEPIDDETKELLRISLENSMRLAKQIAKQKFTPKKYRK